MISAARSINIRADTRQRRPIYRPTKNPDDLPIPGVSFCEPGARTFGKSAVGGRAEVRAVPMRVVFRYLNLHR